MATCARTKTWHPTLPVSSWVCPPPWATYPVSWRPNSRVSSSAEPAWRVVFIISSAMFLVSGTFFLVFITAEKQPWNDVTEAEGEQANAQPDSVEKKKGRKGDETGV
ncbi:uncharacterized protein LOC119594908 [Penaeus monodon]|uniref:uncharacterized protein LOC119594908 n=1 Tax=Penaeus monodon TaxID=6687 RepID=UPI0018A7E12A|nr:uncharacterized protein LOC119594908 [Penaeus monodon]